MDLYISGVGEPGTLAVASHGSRAVASHGVGAEEVSVAVTARSDNHGVGGKALQLTRHQVLGDDAACASVDDDNVLHFIAGIEFYGTGSHLAAQGRICTEQQLLARLSLGIECT